MPLPRSSGGPLWVCEALRSTPASGIPVVVRTRARTSVVRARPTCGKSIATIAAWPPGEPSSSTRACAISGSWAARARALRAAQPRNGNPSGGVMSTRATPASMCQAVVCTGGSPRLAVLTSVGRIAGAALTLSRHMSTVHPLMRDHLPPGGGGFSLRVGLLIDGNGGLPVRDAMIEVIDGRIARLGRAEEFGTRAERAADAGAERVLMPGLVDCHAHPTLFPDRQPFEVQLQAPDEMLALTAVRQLTVHLRSGVTTVRDCAARGQTMFWVREAIRRGYFPGPRLQLAGRAITHSAGHIHWAGGVADTPEEIRRNVRVLVAEGADVIKLVASGGGTRGGIPYLASYTVDELRVGVEAAHALERPTV